MVSQIMGMVKLMMGRNENLLFSPQESCAIMGKTEGEITYETKKVKQNKKASTCLWKPF